VTMPAWPPAVIDQLRVLHAERDPDAPTKPRWSMSIIGTMLSAMPEADRFYGKNHVVGACHRLRLDLRQPSTGRRKKQPSPYAPKAAPPKVGLPRVHVRKVPPPPVMLHPAWAPPALLRLTWTAPLLLTWTEPVIIEAPAPIVPPWEDIPAPQPVQPSIPVPPPPPPPPSPQPRMVEEQRVHMVPPVPRAAPELRQRRSDGLVPAPAPTDNVVPIRKIGCQFPIGHPRTAGFRFCGEKTWSCDDPIESAVYCAEHFRFCHQMNPERERLRRERQLRRA
jgi:hypothetical protein